jgi:protease IV
MGALEGPTSYGGLAPAENSVSKKKSYLELSLKDEIVEGPPEHSIFSRKSRTALHDILDALQHAAKDSRIVALSLTLDKLDSGWARLSDMRRALALFRRSGKPIYCFLHDGGNAEYYLASACDRIFMPPAAHLNLVGLSTEVFFFREVLDRFGVNAQIQSIGEYKSAAEMLTRTGMSPPAREQLNSLLDDYFEELCRAIQERGSTREEVVASINSGPYTAREALKRKLLNDVCYQDEVVDKLKERFGEKIPPLPANKYFTGDGFFKRILTFRRLRIAVINVTGYIDMGESRRNQAGRNIAGAETITGFLDHASQSRRVRAILVRIDSPGGSGLASDLIWRKISVVGKKKPIVVSFGDVAASGGYYIASPAAHIIAESTSITGSIGVLAGKFVARELMNRLSIKRESINRGEHAGYESIFSEFSPEESERLTEQIREFYKEEFLKKVAEGRKMDEEAVDQVGRGRVWSGKRAKERNLVDEIGGFSEAIRQARKLSQIPDSRKIRVVHYYRPRKLWERIMPDFHSPISTRLLPQSLLDAAEIVEAFGRHAILLVMPFQIRIR